MKLKNRFSTSDSCNISFFQQNTTIILYTILSTVVRKNKTASRKNKMKIQLGFSFGGQKEQKSRSKAKSKLKRKFDDEETTPVVSSSSYRTNILQNTTIILYTILSTYVVRKIELRQEKIK